MKYLFIDIRKSDSVYNKQFIKDDNYSYYNIPMNMMRFNKEKIIQHLKYYDLIYLVCESEKQSKFIKNKYFNEHEKIKVSKELQFSRLLDGKNEINLNNNIVKVFISDKKSFNLYSLTRIIQIILGTLILTLGGYTIK